MEPVEPHRESSHREQLFYTVVGRGFWANTRAIASLRYWAGDGCEPLNPSRIWDASNGGGYNPQLTWAAGASFVSPGQRSRYTEVDTDTQCNTEWLRGRLPCTSEKHVHLFLKKTYIFLCLWLFYLYVFLCLYVHASCMSVLVPQEARQLTAAVWLLRIKPKSSGNISQCSLVQSHRLSTKSICFWAAVSAAILEFSVLQKLACLLTLWLSHAVVLVYVIPAWFVSLA